MQKHVSLEQEKAGVGQRGIPALLEVVAATAAVVVCYKSLKWLEPAGLLVSPGLYRYRSFCRWCLEGTNANGFKVPVRVPGEAGKGKARRNVSFPDCEEGKIGRSTFEVSNS